MKWLAESAEIRPQQRLHIGGSHANQERPFLRELSGRFQVIFGQIDRFLLAGCGRIPEQAWVVFAEGLVVLNRELSVNSDWWSCPCSLRSTHFSAGGESCDRS